MKSQDHPKQNMPDTPGVYFFKQGRKTLYIGKATSLRSRTRSYFSKDLIATRGPSIVDMVFKADRIEWKETDSVLEALLLEAELIKKYQPQYNVMEKDDKSYNCVVITRDEFPIVKTVRKHELVSDPLAKKKYQAIYGPFPNGLQLREGLKIIRRIFPYLDDQSSKKDNFIFYKQLGLAPDLDKAPQKHQNSSRFTPQGPYTDKNFDVSAAQTKYNNTIHNLKLFFVGRKKDVIRNMKKEMKEAAELRQFERAALIRNRMFALEHINDVSLIKDDRSLSLERKYFGPAHAFRIEAYDVAHMSGKNMVGVMTVVEDGTVSKNDYRKFIVRTQKGSNDTGALEEVLSRRLRHTEWGVPSLIAVDGSTAQINVAKQVLSRYQLNIPIVAVVKDTSHKPKAIIGDEAIIKEHKKAILLANNEAHRFSITFHKLKRGRNFLPQK